MPVKQNKQVSCCEKCCAFCGLVKFTAEYWTNTLCVVCRQVWYWEPSVLTAICLIGILMSVADFAVPTLNSYIFTSSEWFVRCTLWLCDVDSWTNIKWVARTHNGLSIPAASWLPYCSFSDFGYVMHTLTDADECFTLRLSLAWVINHISCSLAKPLSDQLVVLLQINCFYYSTQMTKALPCHCAVHDQSGNWRRW